jgi:hypothetical protein
VPDLARAAKALRLDRVVTIERPRPQTPASQRLRRLIAVTAVTMAVVEVVSLATLDEPGFGIAVRTGWALLRVLGWLALMRAVRFGRGVSRPFGVVLAVTSVFAVARLVEPRSGALLPEPPVLAGLVVLVALCGAVVWQLYRSPAVAAHLTGRPVRRHVPGWVLTARVAALAYTALLAVPFLVAVGAVAAGTVEDRTLGLALLQIWLGLLLLTGFLVPLGSFFVVVGKAWARWLIGGLGVLLLIAQPLLCYALLRDGTPLVLTVALCLYALHRSRGQPTFQRIPRDRLSP